MLRKTVNSSEGKSSIAVGSQEIPTTKSHHTTNLTQQIYWYKYRMWLHPLGSKELSEGQVLYRVDWRWTFSGGLGLVGFCDLILGFYSVGQCLATGSQGPLDLTVMAIRVFF